ncbi:Bax inhibitor-1/YccA family protein [Micromonospora okii]|uniref:Bax inhibitor-1/YccA family protein n=1 Tax=Micromonospora okii TaxID=1182970 RepID=UPI001E4D86FF|nr:Bax inhibitor-1/YccA family protein [Micromonospora okii]
MRTTTNPAIRSLLTSTGTAPAKRATPQRAHPAYRGGGTGRPLTVDDVVTRTSATLAATVASALATGYLGRGEIVLPAALLALGLGLYLTFRPRASIALTLLYAVTQGVVIGATTKLLDGAFPGVATQAVTGTAAVFVAMLVVYRVRLLRLTTRRVKWFVVVSIGVLALTLVNALAVAVFGVDVGLRGGDGVATVVVSLVCICLAAFSLLLSFDAADRMIRHGVSADWAWYLAFGLVMTLVWLYLEIVWLLSAFR